MICDELEKRERKVIIAGGTGFIGKRVVNLLSKNNFKLYIFSRRKIESRENSIYINIDLKDLKEEECKKINDEYGPFDAAIYLAANIPQKDEKRENYFEACNSTLIPTIKFIEFFSQYVKKIIYASSIDVVGVPNCGFYNEDVVPNPTTPYGLAKLCGENYLKSIAEKYNMKYSILRFSQVYGPFEPIIRVIPILLKSIKENKQFTLYSNGEEKRRFLYVDDAASSILCALNSDCNGIFNIAGKSIDSIKDLINIVENTYRKKINLQQEVPSAIVFDNIPDISKAARELQFKPRYSLEEGIETIFKEENNELK